MAEIGSNRNEVIPQQMSSYASLVDPEEGTVLKYVPVMGVNGHRCARIGRQDIQSEVDYWSTAIICEVLGANPRLDVIDRYVHRIWAHRDIDKVVLVGREGSSSTIHNLVG